MTDTDLRAAVHHHKACPVAGCTYNPDSWNDRAALDSRRRAMTDERLREARGYPDSNGRWHPDPEGGFVRWVSIAALSDPRPDSGPGVMSDAHWAIETLRRNERTEPDSPFWQGWDAALAAIEVALRDTGPRPDNLCRHREGATVCAMYRGHPTGGFGNEGGHYYVEFDYLAAALRDTGPRPDSGIDVERRYEVILRGTPAMMDDAYSRMTKGLRKSRAGFTVMTGPRLARSQTNDEEGTA